MWHGQWLYRNGVVHEQGEGGLLKRGRTLFKSKMRLQMDMGRRCIIPEDKHIFNQWWIGLWDLPGKDKKLWLGEVAAARK